MFRWSAFFLLFASIGCERRCDQVFDKLEADWCYAESTVDAASAGDLGRARRLLAKIQAEKVQAIATDQLIAHAPAGLSRQDALAFCGELMDMYRDRCVATWSNEAMWVRP